MHVEQINPANVRYILEKAKVTREGEYGASIRANVRGLWGGQIDTLSFVDSMVATITRGFRRAWDDGMKAVGMSLEEINPEEDSVLYAETSSELSHIYEFATAINQGSRLSGGKLAPLLKRAEMWTNRYVAITALAMTMAGRDKKLMWHVDITKEHCRTCLRLNNRVYRASTWRRYDIYPRHRSLECGGWRCGCYLSPTSAPATRGRPPSIP